VESPALGSRDDLIQILRSDWCGWGGIRPMRGQLCWLGNFARVSKIFIKKFVLKSFWKMQNYVRFSVILLVNFCFLGSFWKKFGSPDRAMRSVLTVFCAPNFCTFCSSGPIVPFAPLVLFKGVLECQIVLLIFKYKKKKSLQIAGSCDTLLPMQLLSRLLTSRLVFPEWFVGGDSPAWFLSVW